MGKYIYLKVSDTPVKTLWSKAFSKFNNTNTRVLKTVEENFRKKINHIFFKLADTRAKIRCNIVLMNNTAHSETELLHRLSNGDAHAFTTLYKQYYQRIYHFAKTFLYDKQDAEDITADTFIKLWDRRSAFHSIGAIVSFLHITTRNSCFDFLRHHKVKTEKQAELIAQMDLHDYPHLQQTKEELLSLVQKEVRKMSARMKQIFDLSYKEGMTPAEIADLLKLSVQTISNQKTSLLKSLKRALVHTSSFLSFLFLLPLIR